MLGSRRVKLPAAMAGIIVAIALVAGCGKTSDKGGQAATSKSGQSTTAPSVATPLPDDFFLASAPAEASSLLEAKTWASVGDVVTFEARIGGRVEPFTEGAAVFLVADVAIPTCTELHGDGCPSPWDYCCEPKENLMKNMATVQVVDDNGAPLKLNLKGTGGLEPMARIVVVGKVRQVEDAVFVVDSSQIYVEKS